MRYIFYRDYWIVHFMQFDSLIIILRVVWKRAKLIKKISIREMVPSPTGFRIGTSSNRILNWYRFPPSHDIFIYYVKPRGFLPVDLSQ